MTDRQLKPEGGSLDAGRPSLLEALFEKVDLPEVSGRYVPETQTWEHRDWLQFSPVKHNQEM